jgi:negative regulator of replication initiation
MKMYNIEVDEEVYNFLKERAEPFIDTSPNSVLRRLLLFKTRPEESHLDISRKTLPEFPPSIPHALAETLEMIILVKKEGLGRVEATHKVASIRKISTQAVLDKYCRQLDKRAFEIDELLMDSNMGSFKDLLLKKYPRHELTIKDVFSSLIE